MGIEGKAGHFVNKKQEGRDREHVRWCKREMQDAVRKREGAGRRGGGSQSGGQQRAFQRVRGHGVCWDLIEDEHGGGGTSVAV